jgi:hydrogenase expression/formation protein HypE
LEILRADSSGTGACVIGKVTEERSADVFLKSAIGARRILDMASGEQLPRIC